MLSIYVENSDIPLEKLNGTCHSIFWDSDWSDAHVLCVVALQFDNLNSLFLRVKFYNRVVFVTAKRKIYG